MLDGVEEGGLGNLVKDNAARLFTGEAQGFLQVPGNGFSLAVLIGGQPDGVRFGGELAQIGHDFLFLGRNDIFGLEAVLHIDAQFVLFQIADMADGSLHQIIFTQIILYAFYFAGRLDNH